MTIQRLTTILLTGLALAACGDDTTGLDELSAVGTFTAEVTGAQSASLKGFAFFADVLDQPEGFGIEMPAKGGGGIVIMDLAGRRPEAGTYTIETLAAREDIHYIAFYSDGNGVVFGSTGGTLTITSSTSDELAGTFEFTALDTAEGSPDEERVTVSGSFNARGCTANPAGTGCE